MADGGRPRRRTLADEAAARLRALILLGELTGQELHQEDLARRLATSVTPVREALLRLRHEGLLVPAASGYRAVTLTAEDQRDAWATLAAIAGELAARAAAIADDELVAHLRGLGDDIARAGADGRLAEAERLDRAFHRAVNLAAGAPVLLAQLRAGLRFIPDRMFELRPGWAAEADRGHRTIVDAFERRDPVAARAAAAAHVAQAQARALAG